MRIIVASALAWLLFPGGAIAQGGSGKCGDPTDAEVRLERIAPYFTDADQAEIREGLFEQVGATAPRQVILVERVCARIYRAAVRALRATHNNWHDLQRAGFRHTILRYGPYYAVLVNEIPPPGKTYLGWTEMLIFRIEDLSYVGTLMV